MRIVQTAVRSFFRAKHLLRQAAPTILSCAAVVGTVATAISAVKATPKALELLRTERKHKVEDLTALETVTIAAPLYIPALMMCTATICCILGANTINRRRQASLLLAYSVLEQSCQRYKDKFTEYFGADGAKELRRGIMRDDLETEFPTKEARRAEAEKPLFYDELSGRFFNSTIEQVKDAEYHLNRNFVLRGYASLNEFYEFLGLDKTEYGETVGWNFYLGETEYGYEWIDFNHEPVETDDGLECTIIHMPFYPTPDYLD